MKFYFVHIVKVCFVFKKHYAYAYIPPHMHETLSTLRKEKKQKEIKFYEKIVAQVYFLAGDYKISKCFISVECPKSKVTPRHAHYVHSHNHACNL